MNYLLHNLGYDNPIDFRRIVLYTYKGRCMWLRDTRLDSLGLYDYTKWLPDIKYEQSNLERAKKSYKEAKIALAALTEERLRTYFEEELCKYEVLHNSQIVITLIMRPRLSVVPKNITLVLTSGLQFQIPRIG